MAGSRATLLLCVLATAASEEAPGPRGQPSDPLAALDRHLSHSLAQHYLWPWSQLLRAAAALDEDHLEEPQIVSDAHKFQINLRVKQFKPEELRVRVKGRHVIVEGRHVVGDGGQKFVANHFVQRFALPPGCRDAEVAVELGAAGVLSVTAPKHEVPPPPPEREVPIVVLLPDDPPPATATPTAAAPQTPPQLSLTETHGKIRKKELKASKDNEVTKGVDGNVLETARAPEE